MLRKRKINVPDEIEYFTWKSLKRANERAIRLNLNRQVERKYIESLDRTHKFPVMLTLFHEDDFRNIDTIRCIVGFADGGTVQIDVPIKFWKKDVFKMDMPDKTSKRSFYE